MSEKYNDQTQIDQENNILSEDLVRLNKVKEMQKNGFNPWPAYKKVNSKCEKVVYDFEHEISQDKQYSVAGRLMTIRDHGKTLFANLKELF